MKVLDAPNGNTNTWQRPDETPGPFYENSQVSFPWERRDVSVRPMRLVPAESSKARGLALRFMELADTWERETRAESFAHRRSMHLAYQRIIGLGPAAIPLILERMRERQSGHWFWALNVLTGEDPAVGLTKPGEAREAWLRWGVEHRYIASSS